MPEVAGASGGNGIAGTNGVSTLADFWRLSGLADTTGVSSLADGSRQTGLAEMTRNPEPDGAGIAGAFETLPPTGRSGGGKSGALNDVEPALSGWLNFDGSATSVA